MKVTIKFLQGEDIETETSVKVEDILKLLQGSAFGVVSDSPEKTVIAAIQNINQVIIYKDKEEGVDGKQD